MGEGTDAFDALGRELRERVGTELRAETEESERLAAQAGRRKRTLTDVARDLMARGDRVAVGVPGRLFTGVVTYAAGDLLVLETAGGRVDVNLRAPAHLRVVERAPSGGAVATDGPSSFKARLFEIEMSGASVELGCTTVGQDQPGTIVAVAVDHLVWRDRDGEEWFLPLSAVSHVMHRPTR